VVTQSGGTIAVASSTVQGGDDSFPTVDNIGPSLIFWEEKSGMPYFLYSSKGMTWLNALLGFYPMYTHTKFYGIGVVPPEDIGGERYYHQPHIISTAHLGTTR
jgi:hypothetical protein